jgi:hypothetical protein
MTILEHQKALVREARDGLASSHPKVTIDLTVEMVMGQDDVIDQVFDFVFDVLGITTVELRIRERTLGRRVKVPAVSGTAMPHCAAALDA